MAVVAIGLNHRRMPLDLFERIAVGDAQRTKALAVLGSVPGVDEVVLLSTCNRTEVYASTDRPDRAIDGMSAALSDLTFVDPEEIVRHRFVRHDADAVRHLLRVAAGLDSDVLGESEILGQVRTAWSSAFEEGVADRALGLLFAQAIDTGRRARRETAIGRGTASISHAAVDLAAAELRGLAGRQVLLVGAGGMAEGIARTLTRSGADDLLVANRTPERAAELVGRTSGRAIRMYDLPDALVETDVVIASTGSRIPVIERGDLERAMARRGGRRLVVVDLGVPRDVDPGAAEVDGVRLLDMGDLRRFAQRGVEQRGAEVAAVEDIVDRGVERHRAEVAARGTDPLVAALHDRAERVRRDELAHHGTDLAGLAPAEREAVEALTRRIVAKLLHAPTTAVRAAASSETGGELAEALRILHDLDPDVVEPGTRPR